MRGAPRRLGRCGRPRGRRWATGPALLALGEACAAARPARGLPVSVGGGVFGGGGRRSASWKVLGWGSLGRAAPRRGRRGWRLLPRGQVGAPQTFGEERRARSGEAARPRGAEVQWGTRGGRGRLRGRRGVAGRRQLEGRRDTNADELIWGPFEDCPLFPSFPPSPCLSWLHGGEGSEAFLASRSWGRGGQAGEAGALGLRSTLGVFPDCQWFLET